jgi:hypothetical protein
MFSKQITSKIIYCALIFVLFLSATAYALSSSQEFTPIACPAPTAAAPVWGKLVISGNVVTCFYATGIAAPTVWKQIGVPETINFVNNPILIGVYITAHNGNALSTGTIDNFSITPAPTYRLADYDIGMPALMGSANLVSGVWTMTGSGADIWGTSDQCNFQSWLVWGDCTVICRATSLLTSGNAWEKIGIMARDGFNSGSDYALFCASNGGGVAYQYRANFNNNPDIIEYVAPPAPGVKSGIAIGYGLTGGTSYPVRP